LPAHTHGRSFKHDRIAVRRMRMSRHQLSTRCDRMNDIFSVVKATKVTIVTRSTAQTSTPHLIRRPKSSLYHDHEYAGSRHRHLFAELLYSYPISGHLLIDSTPSEIAGGRACARWLGGPPDRALKLCVRVCRRLLCGAGSVTRAINS
jgi:hypothetical protein